MKQGLSLKVSQHLALTPQLQQSIRLLQLSTLELSSEVEQMLDENPFLELDDDQAPREEFGLTRADTRVSEGDRASESALDSGAGGGDEAGAEGASDSDFPGQEGWEGDGSVEVTPDDGEWGGEAPARLSGASDGDDELDPGERPAPQESLTEHLHRQALSLRLTPEDMAALRFLIESLNDDGYLEDSLAQLAATLTDADDDLEQLEELVHRFTMALKLLQSLEPAGVGARDLAECLTLQLKALREDAGDDEERQHTIATALAVCAQHG
ncbi:MAG: RNA polymerase factor sigma-54, partial [Ottowia sp.]|nr:RNA polymerase factor sigma-54 [Ottowia sp.]